MSIRFDRSKFHFGTYILQPYARTERHIRELAECGIDVIVCLNAAADGDPVADKAVLDYMQKYRVGGILTGVLPAWWGGDGDNAGKMAESNPLEKYDEGAKKFIDHPAIWGVDVGDEPSALDFPHYGKVIAHVNRLFPNQFAYLNLYPNYASVAKNTGEETVNQLGTPTYYDHIEEYIKNVPTDYVCYDFYMYSCNPRMAMDNLQIVADACRKTGRSMWIVLQVNSVREEEFMSENQLRFQAYSAMAYGAESIIWACWTGGWWYNNVLDTNGNKTEQYEKLKKVNAELHHIGPAYMKYRRVSTHFIGYPAGHPDVQDVMDKNPPVASLSTGVFMNVESDAPLLAGQMISRSNNTDTALFLCAADDSGDKRPGTVHVTFALQEGYRAFVTTGTDTLGLLPDENGVYHLAIPSCGGVLVEAL